MLQSDKDISVCVLCWLLWQLLWSSQQSLRIRDAQEKTWHGGVCDQPGMAFPDLSPASKMDIREGNKWFNKVNQILRLQLLDQEWMLLEQIQQRLQRWGRAWSTSGKAEHNPDQSGHTAVPCALGWPCWSRDVAPVTLCCPFQPDPSCETSVPRLDLLR